MADRNRMIAAMSDVVFGCVIQYIHDPKDRDAVSLVCKRWYELDALTRKHITIALCYTTTPKQLYKRFSHLDSLKLKGKPRAAMFNLIPEDWGGFVTPWVEEIATSFTSLKAIHFRRMIVKDSDLEIISRSPGLGLEVLKLDKCSDFSTDGLLHITTRCRNLKTLFLEESTIAEKDGNWLHELASHATSLETLNFYMTELVKVRFEDLELIATKCKKLISVKISDCEILNLLAFFRAAGALVEFGGGSISEQPETYSTVTFPRKLSHLGLTYMGKAEMPIIFPFALNLKKLDLLYALLDTDDHCLLIQRCPNLEILEARNVIGDRGLVALSRYCKKLTRLRIERGADEQEMEDEEGLVSQHGLTALANGCLNLEYLAVYVSDITNASLQAIAQNLKNLNDFRLVLLDRQDQITDLPLDEGVRSLLQGCRMLHRFALYLRTGGLTDVGLGYIGRFSEKVRWMLLGYVGTSDEGLLEFSKGCQSLQKLELRGCCFSEQALANAVLRINSLRYLWVQGYRASLDNRDLYGMVRPFWNIELIPPRGDEGGMYEQPAHILAYYSLAGQRTDFPNTVLPLVPNSISNTT